MATAVKFPVIGKWFRRPNGTLFEVVAVDEEDGTIEVSAPEDWSGSVDMDPDDYVGTPENEIPKGFHDPLAFLDET